MNFFYFITVISYFLIIEKIIKFILITQRIKEERLHPKTLQTKT